MSARLAICLAAALLQSGCGGGVTFGFSDGFFDDDLPPAVSLASSVNTVRAGQTVHIVAAASDSDSGIREVRFFRVDGVDNVLLRTDTNPPYEVDVVAPADGRLTLNVYARAQDGAGNFGESATLMFTVGP